MRGRGAEAEREQNPLRKKWVQHPIFRVRFETARSKPSLSSRNVRSARVRPRMCERTFSHISARRSQNVTAVTLRVTGGK